MSSVSLYVVDLVEPREINGKGGDLRALAKGCEFHLGFFRVPEMFAYFNGLYETSPSPARLPPKANNAEYWRLLNSL